MFIARRMHRIRPDERRVQIKEVASPPHQLLIRFASARRKSCALPTWWFWRGGCTRSHSEHGRETPQRRWYFVLRRGRVGRCQVCKAQDKIRKSSRHKTRPSRNARAATKRPFCVGKIETHNGILLRKTRTGKSINRQAVYATAPNPTGICAGRGVEQPGSSSGS